MAVFENAEFDSHEAVYYFYDNATGLRAIVAIHSTALGPAAGGCRLWHYADEAAALTDALRLSHGMSYKNAMARLPLGGGKAVILGDNETAKSTALFESFGRFVASLNGKFITAEDVGVSVQDMLAVSRQTEFVAGLPGHELEAGGDPSPWTAQGVFLGIRAAVSHRLGRSDLDGTTVAVQGIGRVGFSLCEKLHQAGAKLIIADVQQGNLTEAQSRFGAAVLPANEVLVADVDVLAPCALGSILNAETIPRIKAKVIAGAANNQLAGESDGQSLADLEILYAPDYVINAGGIISVSFEYHGDSTAQDVLHHVELIPSRLTEIFQTAERTGKPTSIVADEAARRIVANAANSEPDSTCAVA